jgi:hypothetical protein
MSLFILGIYIFESTTIIWWKFLIYSCFSLLSSKLLLCVEILSRDKYSKQLPVAIYQVVEKQIARRNTTENGLTLSYLHSALFSNGWLYWLLCGPVLMACVGHFLSIYIPETGQSAGDMLALAVWIVVFTFVQFYDPALGTIGCDIYYLQWLVYTVSLFLIMKLAKQHYLLVSTTSILYSSLIYLLGTTETYKKQWNFQIK